MAIKTDIINMAIPQPKINKWDEIYTLLLSRGEKKEAFIFAWMFAGVQ